MDDLLSEFLTETNEYLETVDVQLVQFEADPTDRDILNNIFRLVHTIKGTCGFLGLPRLQMVAHAGETLLDKFRNGDLVATSDSVQLVLESIDQIKVILAGLEASGSEPAGDDSELIHRLEAAAEGKLTASAPAPEPEPAPAPVAAAPAPAPAAEEPPPHPDGLRWDPDLGRHLRPGEVSLAELEAAFLAAETEAAAAPTAAAAAPAAKASAPKGEDDGDDAKGARVADSTIRVSVDVLEGLMTMVSELVLTRNQLLQMVRTTNDSEFKAPLQRLSAITAELQDGVMKTRMQPIGNAWKKLPRIVRDAARDLGKKIDLHMDGESVELDRQVLELIKDPLTHMVRNSCDHGLEKPADRVAAGKSENGVIRLKAFHEGGHIIIELSDDGRGLNTDRIREKAIANGLLTAEAAAAAPDSQIHKLIFAPGFSTAQTVTSISGRGVGMDVVKTNIELIGGQIDLTSAAGKGSVFSIKIPLTLAIVSALVVGAGGERFALPQLSVVELVRAGGGSDTTVENLKGSRVLRLRDRLLPLVDLAALLDLPPRRAVGAASFVVVMQAGGRRFGVEVDEVFDTEEIVVKPLASVLRDVRAFSGATILGDGSVIMISDPAHLAASVGELAETAAETEAATEAAGRSARGARTGMIVFRAGTPEPKAAPLSLVTRLEELDAATFERADGKVLVQYRGKLMPIVPADPYAEVRAEGPQPILVFSHGDQVMGVAVDEILDIIETDASMNMATDRPGVLGVAVIAGKATEIVDVGHYLSSAFGSWDASGGPAAPRRVLIVESDPFFRNLLAPLVAAAGYEVETAESPDDALMLASSGEAFDAVLADVDAQDAGALAEDARLGRRARFALSGRQSYVAGFDATLRKSDRHGLIAALNGALNDNQMGVAA